ncbi:hypothetical protein LTR05_005760 [Lithohypha guttulata]|uniref:Gfd2/YDR514C-like C-terminal domain-containing protein n=1 Tax=Lithohypha guttulata TaxID=1690604 RepID=A0AAN7SZ75_9EURO|nr:hypothetical protein LTR05_005760 [Lithohypha guttulata]
MASQAQARFDKLFQNKPKPAKPIKDGPGFAERELAEYKRRQQELEKARHQPDHDEDTDQPSDKEQASVPAVKQPTRPIKPSHRYPRSSGPGRQLDHIPGTDPEAMVFVPGGIWSGGLAATKLDTEPNHENIEPASSSPDCIGRFCVFNLVTKFPYKYLQDPGNRVSKHFFAGGQIYQRNWNLYYIFGPNSVGRKILLLVPYDQVKVLIDQINNEFKLKVSTPEYPFQLSFYKDGTPCPRFLGVVNSKDDCFALQQSLGDPPENYGQVPSSANDIVKQDYHAWHEKLERACSSEKKGKKGGKKKIRASQGWTIAQHADQLRRAQRYFGLKPSGPKTQIMDGNSSTRVLVEPLNVNAPAPFAFEDGPIIITIDVEAYERDHSIVTEIGVSTLDTADLLNLSPGKQGENWIKKIRSRHFRIKGRERFRNTEFVHGNPDMFQFGLSEFVAIDEAADAVDDCFEYPFSAGFECEGPVERDEQGLPVKTSNRVLDTNGSHLKKDKSRNILLIGHDTGTDIEYLASMGSSIFGKGTAMSTTHPSTSRSQHVRTSVREQLDTAVLYKALTNNAQRMSLTKVCSELEIDAWYTHNAGNDARYTLEVFVKTVIKARLQEDAGVVQENAANPPSADTSGKGVKEGQKTNVDLEAARLQMATKSTDTAAAQFDSSWDTPAATEGEIAEGSQACSDGEYPY